MVGRNLIWFSCGASSAMAAKLAIRKYGSSSCDIVYCDTLESEHPDNARFISDCEGWFGKDIIRIRSDRYRNIDEVFEKTRYMSGIKGARCTSELKKMPREAYSTINDTHIFGFTFEEKKRFESFEYNNPTLYSEAILISQGYNKKACLSSVLEAGIALPKMYDLGFDHNNCLGCVKASSPKYWDLTRVLFPKTFSRRVKQCRMIGSRLAVLRGERVFIDQIPFGETETINEQIECGPLCQVA